MGMLDWFRSIVKGEDKTVANPPAAVGGSEDKGAEVAGLNFKTAVDAHMKWKVRLSGQRLRHHTAVSAAVSDAVSDPDAPAGVTVPEAEKVSGPVSVAAIPPCSSAAPVRPKKSAPDSGSGCESE